MRKGDRARVDETLQVGEVTAITPAPKHRTYLVTLRFPDGTYRDFLEGQVTRLMQPTPATFFSSPEWDDDPLDYDDEAAR